MEALNELKAAEKIKTIGAANMTPEHIKEYLKYGPLDLVQAKYSILDTAIEQDLVPICRENKITIQAYPPLEQGLLSDASQEIMFQQEHNAIKNGSNLKICKKQ